MQLLAKQDVHFAHQQKEILEELQNYPELISGIEDTDYLEENKIFIKRLLSFIFPAVLTKNEIKAVSLPYINYIYNPTERLQNILYNAGPDFSLSFRDYDPQQFYILSCCIILQSYFGVSTANPGFSFIFDIPAKNGIINHFRILNNADFIKIKPAANSKILKQDEIEDLLNNFDNFDLWLEKFPPNSWSLEGFAIINMYNATKEVAMSNLKGRLLQNNDTSFLMGELTTIFRSIFQIKDLEIGYTGIDLSKGTFVASPINSIIPSTMYSEKIEYNDSNEDSTNDMFTNLQKYYTISDVEKSYKENPSDEIVKFLYNKGIRSAIFAAIRKESNQLGVIEMFSKEKSLNGINEINFDEVRPFIEDTLERIYNTYENKISAIIQKEYTSIHPSVYWKFRKEVSRHISFGGEEIDKSNYKKIAFDHLIPFYGQSDVKSSSNLRNEAILKDLKLQIEHLENLFKNIDSEENFAQILLKLQTLKEEFIGNLKANSEADFHFYLTMEIYPILDQLKYENIDNNKKITDYFGLLDSKTKGFYHFRKKFDDSMSFVNKKLSRFLDRKQDLQQQKFPFFYERFKTDGVEHNLYLGASIAPWLSYDEVFENNLRIWQLSAIAETELLFREIQSELSQPLEITSLILVYSTPLSIQFRMDEKRFDVDGSYNARYEIIKKRIDKAHLKNSTERLVKIGTISIVYTQKNDEIKYLNYIKILQKEGKLTDEIEIVELEDLQSIIGLKAIRVAVNYN
ncbi:GAF domain-containing protein [Frigoriflavimonas asaccharolytica]|uniref:GAF domain-containing protein n=1 Tax=Frigoriflavimonas asaccharolytica TaxID=2735899 RepID=A0A8J8GBT0_9FLAO|nr:GAF domain-containing protein [Frigoriflavimonas asaccharolytica]NRS93314.1 hypothetical protein [Frigoriflavimonas asaccharolytica]